MAEQTVKAESVRRMHPGGYPDGEDQVIFFELGGQHVIVFAYEQGESPQVFAYDDVDQFEVQRQHAYSEMGQSVTRFEGDEVATRDGVVRYLLDNYQARNGDQLLRSQVEKLVDEPKHKVVLEDGMRVAAYSKHVGGLIASAAEELHYAEPVSVRGWFHRANQPSEPNEDGRE